MKNIWWIQIKYVLLQRRSAPPEAGDEMML